MTCYNSAFTLMAERELPYNPASMAIADAMMLAQIQLIDRDWDFFQQAESDLSLNERRLLREERMMQRTNGECLASVRTAVDYLSRSHEAKFDSITVILAEARTAPILHDWGKHYYFLAKDKHGVWHAGSPANHLSIDRESRLTTPIVSADLEMVLGQIKKRERGKWPDASYITEITTDPALRMPQVRLNSITNTDHRFVTTMVSLEGNSNWNYQLPLYRA